MASNVSFLRLLIYKTSNLSRGFYFLAEKGTLYFFGFLLALSLYALSTESFFLSFIPELSDGLHAMADISSKSGRSSKKTISDSLWLPTATNQTVYAGDALFTESESTLIIKLNEFAKLFVEPDSYLRLREIDGKPLIRLSKGVIKAEVTDEQIIFIKKGAMIEKAILQKGTYFIKNDQTSGIQITAYDQNMNLAHGKKENSEQTKTSMAQPDDDPQTDSKGGPNLDNNDPVNAVEQEIQYELPTPNQGTIFLIKNPKEIAIGAFAKCPNSCTLKVYFNQSNILEKSMKLNEPAVLKISPDKILEGYYEWTFETETSQFKSDFKVKKFSEDELSNALLNEIPVERDIFKSCG